MSADVERPSRTRIITQDACSMYMQSLAPWGALAAMTVGGVCVQAANVGVGDVVGVVPIAAGGAYFLVTAIARRRAIAAGRIDRRQRDGKRVKRIARNARRAAGAAAAGATWLVLTAATDPTSVAGHVVWLVGIAGWAVMSYPWWRHVDQKLERSAVTTVAVPPPCPTQPPEDPLAIRVAEVWAQRIGNATGPLAGTRLVDFRRLPACAAGDQSRQRRTNWTARVVAIESGSINMRELRPLLLGRIAAAYECGYGDVAFFTDPYNLSRADVRVQPDNLLAEVRMWPGYDATDWSSGASHVGWYDDGQPMIYQWWKRGYGALHALLSGCTGSGKSELVAQLLLISLHSGGLVLDWVGDPQGGQSYGQLKDLVDWFAGTPTEIKLMLLSAKIEMIRRNQILATAYTKTWTPSQEMPLLVVTLDEVQSYIDDPDTLQLVTDLAGQARKCGISLRLLTQVPSAGNLGGSIYIKDQVRTQAFIGRAATGIAGHLAVDSDSPFDPCALPATWGPETSSPDGTTAGLMGVQGMRGRDLYGRVYYTGDDMSAWLTGELTPGTFGLDAQAAPGQAQLWGERHRRAAAQCGMTLEDFLPAGKAVELVELAAGNTDPPLALDSAAPQEMTARDVVLAAAREAAVDGVVTRQAIVSATSGMPSSTRDRAITDLLMGGHLARVEGQRGSYRLL